MPRKQSRWVDASIPPLPDGYAHVRLGSPYQSAVARVAYCAVLSQAFPEAQTVARFFRRLSEMWYAELGAGGSKTPPAWWICASTATRRLQSWRFGLCSELRVCPPMVSYPYTGELPCRKAFCPFCWSHSMVLPVVLRHRRLNPQQLAGLYLVLLDVSKELPMEPPEDKTAACGLLASMTPWKGRGKQTRGVEAVQYFSYNLVLRRWYLVTRALVAVAGPPYVAPYVFPESRLAEALYKVDRVTKLGPASSWAQRRKGLAEVLRYDAASWLGLDGQLKPHAPTRLMLSAFYESRRSLLSLRRRFTSGVFYEQSSDRGAPENA